MKRGEVWIVDLPGLGGHTQEGRRPVVIVADPATPLIVIVPITSNFLTLNFPNTVQISPSKENGLSRESVLMAFQIRALDRSFLVQKIGTIGRRALDELNSSLRDLLSL